MAEEWGQHQRSCFSNMALEATVKTDESPSDFAYPSMVVTAETDKSLLTAVSSVLAVPFWPVRAIEAFTRSAHVIIWSPS
jgi:hypothetical protein